jgi:phospholipid/cholesterol/gamma-HCH transport system substrate-binding protein
VLSLEKEVELLEDASISIRETSLLGGRHVFIDPGTFGGPVLPPSEDGAYFGQVFKNPIASFGDIGEQLSVVLSENRESIRDIVANLDAITTDVREGRGLVGRVIHDPELGANASKFVANVTETSEQLKSGKGLLGALFYDEAIRQQFADTVASLKELGEDLRSRQGVLGALIDDPELRDRVTRGIDSFVAFGEKLNQGEGALGMLMSDAETKTQLKTLIADLSASMADVRVLVADVKAGKGTVGKLLTEDAVYQDLRNMVNVVNRSLEDYREAAPITAFTSVLFAAF